MVMRVGGLASGMDIEAMVNKLMEAERLPLTRMQQQQTTLEWKRDSFRDINSSLLELDNIVRDMKYSTAYKSKAATSSNENAVKATANSDASNGTYQIEVVNLATNAMNIGQTSLKSSDTLEAGEQVFYTFDEEGGKVEHKLVIEEGDSLKKVLDKIGTVSDGKVRAFIDNDSGRVVLETTRTGKYNTNPEFMVDGKNPEIHFENGAFFSETLNLNARNETGGTNAQFKYNDGLTIDSKNNSYTLNGVNFNFQSKGISRVTVDTNVEQPFDNIMKFVDKYNEAIEKMNKSQTEEKFRDFPPLTEEQKADMTEDQIKKWEEKAKSAILRRESSITDGMLALRQSLQSVVETGGEFTMLSQIGITTTKNYMDGGKLEVDEDKLKAALRDNTDDVYKLFSNSSDGSSRGLIHRFDDALDQTREKIEKQAGKASHTLDNYTIGKRMKDLNERISDFEKRMVRVEQRYWNQFTQMEKAISSLNQQSSYLVSQFGGGM